MQIDPLNYRVTQSYNGVSQPTARQDGRGGIVTQVYGNRGWLQNVINEVGYARTVLYDPAGNVVTLVSFGGNTAVHTRDANDRIVSTAYSAGNGTAQWVYDAVGNVVTAIAPISGASTTYAYDGADRRTGRTDPGGVSIRNAYNLDNTRAVLYGPDSGQTTFSYDLDARLTGFVAADGTATTQVYDAASRVILRTGYPAQRVGYGRDAVGQVVTMISDNGGSGVFARYTYAYDLVGNRTNVQDLGSVTTYGLDAKSRLVSDTTSGTNAHAYTYSYDANDNRLSSTETGALTQYTFDAANRLLTAISGGATTTYTYSPEGTLSQVSEPPGGNLYTFGQDGGFRPSWQASSAGGRTTWMYDADGRLATTVGPAPTGVVTVIWDMDGYNYLEIRS